MPIQAPKIMFWGVLTLKFYFLSPRPPKGTFCAETRVLSPYWSWSVLRCDLEARRKVQKKTNQK